MLRGIISPGSWKGAGSGREATVSSPEAELFFNRLSSGKLWRRCSGEIVVAGTGVLGGRGNSRLEVSANQVGEGLEKRIRSNRGLSLVLWAVSVRWPGAGFRREFRSEVHRRGAGRLNGGRRLGIRRPAGAFPPYRGIFSGVFFATAYLFDFVDYYVCGKRFLALISR